MKRFGTLSLLLALWGITRLAHADGFIIITEEHWHPRPPMPGPPVHVFAPLEVTYHHVNVKIDGQIATTSVDEEFYNPNSQRLEGTYVFPVPKGAQIDKFTMEIGGKQVEAELLAADKARGIYEDIVRKLRDPALLEYAGRDIFKVRIFPIEPNSTKRVTLSYSQVLTADAGMIGYTYPLNTEKFSAAPIKNVSIKVELNSKRPLNTIYSPSHTVEIKRDGPNRATVAYETSEARPDTDFELYFAPEKEEVGVNLLTYKTGAEDGYFLLLASPAVETKAARVVPKDVAIVLDTSGSMMGKKIDQAKKALQFCVENLNDNDRFEVIRFSTEVEPVFGKLVEASKSNREHAEHFVQDLKAIGATDINDAMQTALKLRPAEGDRPFVVIFLTDGQPTVGVTDSDEIVSHTKDWSGGHTRVFCFGIGTDVNTHLLDRIAEETRAASQFVLPEEDLEVKVSSFFAKIKEPVLANPTLAFGGDVRANRLYPSTLPDLFKGEQLVVVGRYSGHGKSAAVIEGTVNGENKKFAQDVAFSESSADSAFIPRLWATRRVGYLLEQIRLHGENAELRDEVTDLARRYGIVTPYTAYLITEDESRRGVPVAVQSLPQLRADKDVARTAAENWDSFKNADTGERALAAARYNRAVMDAGGGGGGGFGGGGVAATVEANRALGFANATPGAAATITLNATLADAPAARLVQYAEQGQGQFVGGRNFFQNSNNWVDSLVQQNANTKRVRIQFGSPEYFDFAAKNSAALPWLALGQNVQFVLNDTVYEIYE